MPLPKQIKAVLGPEGLVGTTRDGTTIPIGVMRDGQPVLLLRHFEDERESCDHCGGLFCIGASDDDDERCGRCNKSHRECQGCDRMDAETCIHCDCDWCEDCWRISAHTDDCDLPPQETKS